MTTTNDNDSKPVATGVGAVLGGAAGGVAGGAAAGAAVGGMTGPVGAAVGAVVGAVAGVIAGRSVAKADPVAEDNYWRDNYASRDYVPSGSRYEDFGPAYAYGVDAFRQQPDRSFSDVEGDLGRNWDRARGDSSLTWDRAKSATQDSWHRLSDRVERAVPGDSDRDGK